MHIRQNGKRFVGQALAMMQSVQRDGQGDRAVAVLCRTQSCSEERELCRFRIDKPARARFPARGRPSCCKHEADCRQATMVAHSGGRGSRLRNARLRVATFAVEPSRT